MIGSMRLLASAAVSAGLLLGWSGTGTATAQSACADLGGVSTDHTCHVHSATTVYTVDFSFPLDYPDQRSVADYVTEERRDFVDFVQKQRPPDFPYELDGNGTAYESGTAGTGTKSMVFEVYMESGGAHPTTSYKAFNYDLGTGAPVTFDTLFNPDAGTLAALDRIVARELEKRGHPTPQPFNDVGAEAYQNFAITDDAVIFFFSQGLVLSQVDGPLEIAVPRNELATLLAATYQTRM